VHVRFTFDSTPFRRMLRALLATSTPRRTMQLLPPQLTSSSSLSGNTVSLVCFPKSCGRPDSSLIVVVVTRPVCCVCSVCLCESSCQRRSAGSFLSCQLSPKLCHTHAAALATTPSMLPLLPCPAALQTMPASLLFDLECHAKICLVTLALLFLAKKACA